jgi:hypothetical protein
MESVAKSVEFEGDGAGAGLGAGGKIRPSEETVNSSESEHSTPFMTAYAIIVYFPSSPGTLKVASKNP